MTRACVLALVVSVAAPAGAAAEPIFRFQPTFWTNLHHFLYVLGRVEAQMSDIGRRAVADAPKDEAQGLERASEAERAAWRVAVTHYARTLSRRDAVFNRELIGVTTALVGAGDAPSLEGLDLDADLVRALDRAAPVYRKLWWPAHQTANRARIAELTRQVDALGAPVLAFVTKVYDLAWPTDGYPVQVAAYSNWAGAYSTGDKILLVASLDPELEGVRGFETVFHEAMHQWDDVMRDRIDARARALGVERDGRLSHAIIFYTAGEAVRRVVPGYVPYADANGVWARGWETHKAKLDAHWQPYLDGKTTMEAALTGLLR